MGAITTLAKRVNRLAKDTREHHEETLDGGVVSIMPSDAALADRLTSLLGVPVGARSWPSPTSPSATWSSSRALMTSATSPG